MARRTQTSKLIEMDVADFNRLTKAELKKAVRTLAYSANRRLREFENEGRSRQQPGTRRSQGAFSQAEEKTQLTNSEPSS